MAKQMRKNELEGAVDVDSEQQGIPDVAADAVATNDAAASSEAGAEAPTEAGVDPAVEAVAAVVGKVAKKPSRKAKLKAAAAPVQGELVAVPDYAALGLSAEDAQEVEALRLAYSELGRRSTEHVFECGAVMDAVHRIAPDQKAFGKLVKEAFGISRTGAENLARVYRNLQPHRARLARLGIAASSLYVMATAETDKVEEVLAVAEGGEKLSVKRVKSMLGIDLARPGAVADDGGPAGLRARIAEKTAMGVKQVMDDAESLLTMVLVLVHDHSQGKRLVIKDIERPFRYPARMLRERLRWLTLLAVAAPKGAGEGAIHQKPPSESQKWWELLLTLEKLGGSWPKAGEVGG